MNKLRFTINAFAIAFFTLVCASLAQAQATRTWVSGVGNDADPCSRTAPCKTFAGAISKTVEGGEISVVDPGGYGSVTITKSITIDGGTGAGWASILASKGSSGIIINATEKTAVVTLRNLSINGLRDCSIEDCAGSTGIKFLAGQTLHVQNVNIFGFPKNGIDITQQAGDIKVTIQDSTIRECGGSGVSATSSVSNVAVTLTNVHIDKCTTAVSALANSVVSIRNSTLGVSTTGLDTAATSETNIDNTLFTFNTTGINVVPSAKVRLSDSILANNITGVANNGLTLSAGNNKFMGNITDTSGGAFGSLVVL